MDLVLVDGLFLKVARDDTNRIIEVNPTEVTIKRQRAVFDDSGEVVIDYNNVYIGCERVRFYEFKDVAHWIEKKSLKGMQDTSTFLSVVLKFDSSVKKNDTLIDNDFSVYEVVAIKNYNYKKNKSPFGLCYKKVALVRRVENKDERYSF